MKIFAILLSLVCLPAFSADYLVVDLFTKHSSECQVSYSLVCEPWKQPKRLSWQHDLYEPLGISSDIGGGTNSHGNTSFNAGLLIQPIKLGPVRAGVFTTLVSGYTEQQMRSRPFAAGFSASLYGGNSTLQVLFIPAVGDGTVAVVNLRGGFSF